MTYYCTESYTEISYQIDIRYFKTVYQITCWQFCDWVLSIRKDNVEKMVDILMDIKDRGQYSKYVHDAVKYSWNKTPTYHLNKYLIKSITKSRGVPNYINGALVPDILKALADANIITKDKLGIFDLDEGLKRLVAMR